MKPQLGQCACGAEWATVVIESSLGKAIVGPRCAGIVIAVGKLMGLNTRTRPLLKAVQ